MQLFRGPGRGTPRDHNFDAEASWFVQPTNFTDRSYPKRESDGVIASTRRSRVEIVASFAHIDVYRYSAGPMLLLRTCSTARRLL